MSDGYFSSDTQILLADGSYKNITQIVPGDMVLNMHIKPVQVLKVHKGEKLPMCAMKYQNWYTPFYCTRDARILTMDNGAMGNEDTQWKKIDELNKDTNLCTAWEIYLYLPRRFDTKEFITKNEGEEKESNPLF